MAHDHEIDAILALPMHGKKKPGEGEPEEADDGKDAEDEALTDLFEAAKGDDLARFKECFRRAVELARAPGDDEEEEGEPEEGKEY